MNADFRLDGKVAMVTGVGPAMGKDFCLALARAGADVCATARSRAVIDDVAGEIEAMGRRAIALTVDATDSAQIDEAVQQAIRELGRLDVFCNHAGQGVQKFPLLEMPDEAWDDSMSLALDSVFYGTRSAARAMVKQGRGGSIINTSSIVSIGTFPMELLSYSTAKAAVNHFTRYAAMELAPHDIRVNAILPGFFEVANISPESLAWLESNTPMRRPSRVDECSPALIYLASDASSYVTGVTLNVSGGGFLTR